MDKKNKAGSAVVYVTIIVLFAKALGFIKQMLTAQYFGATIQTDLISISEGLITNIDYLLVQTLTTAFVPTYIYVKNREECENKRFVANTIFVFFTVSFVITFILFVSAPIVSKILAPSYTQENSYRLANYIRIVSPSLIALVLSAIFNSLLKGNESFVPGEMISIFQSVILIICIVTFGNKIGADTLVYSFICYALFSLAFLAVYSKKHWDVRFNTPFEDENVKKLLRMMGPLLLGYSIVFVNQQVDKIIVSGLGDGVVSAMGYASVLSNFVCTFIGSICGVLFVYITQNIVNGKKKEAAHFVVQSTAQMITIVLPVFIITICNSVDIVTIVFGRGKFDDNAIHACSYALIGYGIMFVPYVIRELFSRFQYGYGDSKHPMINSSIGILINIIASIILSRFFGVLGVTVATSISVLVCGVLNIKSSMRMNDYVKLRDMKKYCMPWFAGVVFCLFVSLGGTRIFENMNALLRVTAITFVSFLGFYVINYKTVKPMIMTIIHKCDT